MPLEAGTKLGPYEVTAPIGAGGMGEVYRARDTKLNRDVALKVLPEAFVSEPERLARFQREAEVLASLNHPNIAHIYGLEDSGTTTAIVLELVEGETLAERIARGPIPLDEALDIANQITNALGAAHASGVIHRDLKPANVKITPDGVVKVLDFGLAKALMSGTSHDSAEVELSQSPTLTKGTAMGAILGTAAYMSPEQAKGKPVDTRTDVWAFGVVLYEMLAGERAFKGEDVSDTLVSVFRDEPDWTALSADVPPSVVRAIRVCLEKNAQERVRDITAVRLAMRGAFETETARPLVDNASSRSRAIIALLAAGLCVSAGIALWSVTRPTPGATALSRTEIVIPQTHVRTNTGRRGIAISPDGTSVAYVANRQLYLRAIDELEAKPLIATEGYAPTHPLFSPDGEWLAFYARGQLWKVAVTGGPPISLASAINVYGTSWSGDTIFYGQGQSGIYRVSAAGGEPELVIPMENNERAHGPQLLSDGRSLLFTVGRADDWDQARVVVQSLDTGKRRVVVGGSDGRYLPTGHLIYFLADQLLAIRFDRDRLETVGGAVPLVEHVIRAGTSGAANFDVSRDGSLVYLVGRGPVGRTLAWVSRDGAEDLIAADSHDYRVARISPDGTRAVLEVREEGDYLLIWDFARETATRFTFGPGGSRFPEWMQDGQSVVFTRTGIEQNLYRQAVDGTGEPELLSDRPGGQFPLSVTPDGTGLVFHNITERSDFDFALMGLSDVEGSNGERHVESLLDNDLHLDNAHLSPNGLWLAYEVNSTEGFDVDEIFVRPFPDVDTGRWQITSSGEYPLWGPGSDELFFWVRGEGMMRVAVDTSSGFRVETREHVFESGSYYVNPVNRSFDLTPDGKRFLMIQEGAVTTPDDPYAGLTRIVVVQNWYQALEARVPAN